MSVESYAATKVHLRDLHLLYEIEVDTRLHGTVRMYIAGEHLFPGLVKCIIDDGTLIIDGQGIKGNENLAILIKVPVGTHVTGENVTQVMGTVPFATMAQLNSQGPSLIVNQGVDEAEEAAGVGETARIIRRQKGLGRIEVAAMFGYSMAEVIFLENGYADLNRTIKYQLTLENYVIV